MNMTFIMAASLTVSLLEIAIHVLNLLILIVFLRWLLYNPVIKFMDQRKAKVSEQLDEAQKLNSEAQKIISETDVIIAEANKKAESIGFDATKEAENKSREVLAEARRKADDMLDRAKIDINQQKEQMEKEVKNQMADVAVAIAEKILDREVSQSDNKKLVEESLQNWGK